MASVVKFTDAKQITMGRTFLLVVTLSSFACLCGCSQEGHLSRSRAEALLRKALALMPSGDQNLPIQIGTVSGTCNDMSDFDPVESGDDYKALSSGGYLKVQPIGNHVWDISLTELGHETVEGEPYGHTQKANCDSWQVTFPLSTSDGIKIVEIVQDGPHAKVDAIFKWKITPVGESIREQVAVLKLSEDSAKRLLADVPESGTTYSTSRAAVFDRSGETWSLHGLEKE